MTKKKSSTKQSIPKSKSGLEDEIFKQLRSARVPFTYEPKKLLYRLSKYYIPDIELPNKILLELKGHFDYEDREKMLAVKEMNPDLDIRMIFQSDGYINKQSKGLKKKKLDIKKKRGKITREETADLNKNRMKYSDWCIKHHFRFAIGKVPQAWLDE